MEILEAFDLTGSYRAAAELAGCDHHTVARYVAAREAGRGPERMHAERLADPFAAKIEEWVERSNGRVGADVCHRKLTGMGYEGSERTTRRAVAAAKRAWRAGNRRVYRPWIPEPGLWLQFDWAAGPRVAGRGTYLWCAWLAWSRFRVVLPAADRSLPTLLGCLDQTLRRLGGVPTYALTDNERTVTMGHVASIAVRHPQIVAAGRHYGITVTTCVPADPESKGGAEATVRIAKRDLLPTEVNLRPDYTSFAELEQAAAVFCGQVNARPHRETGRRRCSCWPRNEPAAPGPGHAADVRVRGDPEGDVGLHDQRRWGALLGAVRADRGAGVGAVVRRGASGHPRRSARAGRSGQAPPVHARPPVH